MALVEASHYTDEDGLRQQVGRYTAPPVRLQRGGLGKLAIAFVAAVGSGAAMYFAVTSGPSVSSTSASAPSGDSIVLTMAAPGSQTSDDELGESRESDFGAANQLALLAGAAPLPEPESRFVDLNAVGGLSGQSLVVAPHSEPEASPESVPEPAGSHDARQQEEAEHESVALVSPQQPVEASPSLEEALEIEPRIPEPRLKPQSEPQQAPASEQLAIADDVVPADDTADESSQAPETAESHEVAQVELDDTPFYITPPAPPVPATVQTEQGFQTAAATRKADAVTPASSLGGIMLNVAPWARITERSPNGLLPVTGPGGEMSRDYYARPFPADEKRPRISIVIGGLGLSQKATAAAIDNLPPEVTLAFAPYGKNLQTWINRARGRGHEVLLELPMEPFDYPANDPGPYTLLTNNSADQNIQRLNWLLAQFNGYIGVTNYLGAKFTSTPEALLPVLRTLDERGLLVLDDGTSNRSLVPSMARKMNVPFGASARTIDLRVSRTAIDDALIGLEDVTRRQGFAVGMGYAYPVTIGRILLWAETLDEKGFVLAPVSANIQGIERDKSFDQSANNY